jgi:hypothetical protein
VDIAHGWTQPPRNVGYYGDEAVVGGSCRW